MTKPHMLPASIKAKRDSLEAVESQVRWCDDEGLAGENMAGASPGGDLNPFGWYVVGTTIGGNGIVVGEEDPGVFYADHTWYGGAAICFEDLANGGEWVEAPLNAEGVRRSLYQVAESIEDFSVRAEEIDGRLDEID